MISSPLAILRASGLLALTLFLMGCATSHILTVDALRDDRYIPPRSSEPTLYYLTSADSMEQRETLRFREAAGFVETALAARGYARTQDRMRAQVIIEMDATLSDPQSQTQNFSEPIYVRRWGYSRVLRVPIVNERGQVTGFTYTRIIEPPRTELAGWVDRERRITVFEKALSLSAFEARSGERGAELWTIRVAKVDDSNDLRAALPHLAAGAYPFIGEQTEGKVTVRIRENDENLAFIRRGI
ncbi:MAG: hypothetical protein JJT96_13155 [Opitutales bacterium]|nr:hypothetical protein [Opitutales bacterium]